MKITVTRIIEAGGKRIEETAQQELDEVSIYTDSGEIAKNLFRALPQLRELTMQQENAA